MTTPTHNDTPSASGAIEATTFRLNGCSGADFVAANREIDDWLKRQPGFRWRRLAQEADGSIVDVLLWDSVRDAEAGAAGIMTEMGHSVVHAMIDQATGIWRVAPVLAHTAI
jgi:hypothetical protein